MHRCILRGLKAGVSVCAPKLSAQKSFLGQYILSSKYTGSSWVTNAYLEYIRSVFKNLNLDNF